MKKSIERIIPLIENAIESNLDKFREEPESDGDTHDQWDEENDAIDTLRDALDEFINAFDECNAVRPSLGRTNINITK
jgi:hypothetical protein